MCKNVCLWDLYHSNQKVPFNICMCHGTWKWSENYLHLPGRHAHTARPWDARFWGKEENSCSSKFVQLLLLNRAKARWSKNRAAQGFHWINSFISIFFWPNSKACTCEVRAAWGRVSQGLIVFIIQDWWLTCDELLLKEKTNLVIPSMFDIWFLPILFHRHKDWVGYSCHDHKLMFHSY